MFKISVPITKSVKKGNKLIVEGYASDTTIDRDEERFAESAIQSMKDSILKGNVQIRLEHENKFYTNIGLWTEADVTKDNRLYVKGEIDTELSLGKDVEVLLKRGQGLELSVGGKVEDAIYEYSKELGKNIKTYLKVILEEISILLTPSNYNTELGIAKSVDWSRLEKGKSNEGIPYTNTAKKFTDLFKSMEKIDPDLYKTIYGQDLQVSETSKEESGVTKEETKKEDKMTPCLVELSNKVESVFKDSECEICYDDCCVSSYDTPLTIGDLSVIYKLTEIMNQVTLPSDEEERGMYTETYWDALMELGDECFIILSNGDKVMPHHNADYSVNRDWVLIRLKQLIESPNWYSTVDYGIIVNHLYRHLKELSLIKSAGTKGNPTFPHITKEEAFMLKSAYDFMHTDTKEAPKTLSGEVMKGKAVEECSKVYENLIANNNFNSLINKLYMDNIKKEEGQTVETEVETKVETTPSEVPGSTDKPATETPVKEEVSTTETQITESTQVSHAKPVENTSEVVEEKNEEKKEEMENKSVDAKESVDQMTKSQKEGFAKGLADMQKSVSDLESKLDTSANQVVELSKSMKVLADLVEQMAEVSKGRKGVRSFYALEKSAIQGTDAINQKMESIVKADTSKSPFVEKYKKMKLELEGGEEAA